jgi:predicted solute-binding protein
MNLDTIYQEALEYEKVEEPTNDLSQAWSELEYQAFTYALIGGVEDS